MICYLKKPPLPALGDCDALGFPALTRAMPGFNPALKRIAVSSSLVGRLNRTEQIVWRQLRQQPGLMVSIVSSGCLDEASRAKRPGSPNAQEA